MPGGEIKKWKLSMRECVILNVIYPGTY